MKSARALNNATALMLFVLAITAPRSAPAADAGTAYPARPVRIVVPSTPGGQPDIVARLIVPRLGESMGQQFVVDNRPGAGTVIGTRIVATATADGHTLLTASGAHAIVPVVRAKPGFDTVKDFSGISMTAKAAYFLVVSPSLGVSSVNEFIAYAKSRPGQINFASAGMGTSTHFAGEMLKARAGIEAVHVPHRGIPEALTETMTGRIHFFMAPFGSSIALVRGGKLRALAVSTAARTRTTPELPTVVEAGVPDYQYDTWNAIYAPAGTPRSIINRLNREIAAALRQADVEKQLHAMGIEPTPSSPAELDRFVVEQIRLARNLARQAGIKPE